MSTEAPPIHRLEALVDNIHQPDYKVKVISSENEEDVHEAANLLEAVWSESEPLSVAVLSDPDYQERGIQQRFHHFCFDVCRLSSELSLLLAVIHTPSAKMVSLLVGLPCTDDIYPRLTSSLGVRDPMAPWLDILHQLDHPLDRAVKLLDKDTRASLKLLDFFGAATVKSHAGNHLMHLLRYGLARLGLELGYTHIIGKFSSEWQEAITSRWGWQFLGEAVYHEYEFMGTKPFRSIPSPAAVQLAWTELATIPAP